MATPQPAPDLPTPVTGPVCAACGTRAVVNWQRRLTDTEVAEAVAAEKDRRAEILLLADHQQPPPDFGPLPTGSDMLRAVYACAVHAITLDAAALIHQAVCSAPNPADLPGCDCTPEAYPQAAPELVPEPVSSLPAHWVTGAV